MKRIIFFTLILTMIFTSLLGCTKKSSVDHTNYAQQTKVTIAGLKGPTSIGMIKMMDEKALNNGDYDVRYLAESAPDSLVGKIINGDIQISSIPINLASVLYNKTGGDIQILAINTI